MCVLLPWAQNGMAVCDVTAATSTQLTCVTRALLATDASATDALALNVKPISSDPGQVRPWRPGSPSLARPLAGSR